MTENIHQQLGCTCRGRFSTQEDLLSHLEAAKRRVEELMSELRECLSHSICRIDPDNLQSTSIVGPPGSIENDQVGLAYMCPHAEYIECREACVFCGTSVSRVSKYVGHIERCMRRNKTKCQPERQQQDGGGIYTQNRRFAQRRVKTLMEIVAKELRLKMGVDDSDSEQVSDEELQMLDCHQDSPQSQQSRSPHLRKRKRAKICDSSSSIDLRPPSLLDANYLRAGTEPLSHAISGFGTDSTEPAAPVPQEPDPGVSLFQDEIPSLGHTVGAADDAALLGGPSFVYSHMMNGKETTVPSTALAPFLSFTIDRSLGLGRVSGMGTEGEQDCLQQDSSLRWVDD
ncbi:uncharacterized protein NECHADRAFT_100720 [Fusarium vanettenii 77-13-4]|uniref:Uncharacterized protein n=1 Tax=Fusarium vanettenii (strain ATCC MYA-4622 / CBS 123669 / FGSC 9596 / NRRL 45880 / 77-13-4) TaxID=660122 RepID=C7YT44_FUSV7|nr:uncharacterized protein NECHADRAFT_100720 [Fusarium vanettenii 77-13-4]EEU45347.1 predicted protein [Fusarium vanettenii 77-13-4]